MTQRREKGSLAPFVAVAMAALTAGSLLVFSLVAQKTSSRGFTSPRGVVAQSPPDPTPRSIVLPDTPSAADGSGAGVTGPTVVDLVAPPATTPAVPPPAAGSAPEQRREGPAATPRDATNSPSFTPREPRFDLFSRVGDEEEAGRGKAKKALGPKAKSRDERGHQRKQKGKKGPKKSHAARNAPAAKGRPHSAAHPGASGHPRPAGGRQANGPSNDPPPEQARANSSPPRGHATGYSKPGPAKHSNTRGKGHSKARGRGHASD